MLNLMPLAILFAVSHPQYGLRRDRPTFQEDAPFVSRVPGGFGYNIHFVDPKPGEMERLRLSGATVVRMDFQWQAIEKIKGVYDFSGYDRLVAACLQNGIRPYFILDYGNPYYQEGSPSTDEAQAAFVRFASAGVARYKGKGIVWEIWNEPNILPFWTPTPNVEDYIRLAKKTAVAVRRADPNATILAPATSGFDWHFLEATFESGLLDLIDGVSVHPYRRTAPETVWEDYRRLNGMIQFYSPKRKLPIVSGEWGYSTAWDGVSDAVQGNYLVRQWAINFAAGVPISIFYDWQDDGADPKNPEHRFGVVRQNFDAKPAYRQGQDFLRMMRGYQRVARVRSTVKDQVRVVIAKPSATGDPTEFAELTWNSRTGDLPKITPLGSDIPVKFAAQWLADPSKIDRPVETMAKSESALIESAVEILHPPLSVIRADWQGSPMLILENESRLTSQVVLRGERESRQRVEPLSIRWIPSTGRPDLLEAETSFASQKGKADLPGKFPVKARYSQPRVLTKMTTELFVQNGLASAVTIDVSPTQGEAPAKTSFVTNYQLRPGWCFWMMNPNAEAEIPADAVAALVWVKVSANDNWLRSRFTDASGQTFQVDLGNLQTKPVRAGWRVLRIPLTGKGAAVWGGKADGIVSGRTRWSGMILVDSARTQNPQSGSVEVGPVWYELKN